MPEEEYDYEKAFGNLLELKQVESSDLKMRGGRVPIKKERKPIEALEFKSVTKRLRWRSLKGNPLAEQELPKVIRTMISEHTDDTLMVSDRLIETFLNESRSPSADELNDVIEEAVLLCRKSESTGVCANLLEVADIINYIGKGKGSLNPKEMTAAQHRRYKALGKLTKSLRDEAAKVFSKRFDF